MTIETLQNAVFAFVDKQVTAMPGGDWKKFLIAAIVLANEDRIKGDALAAASQFGAVSESGEVDAERIADILRKTIKKVGEFPVTHQAIAPSSFMVGEAEVEDFIAVMKQSAS